MPEGHTIHRLALDHTKELAGKRVRVASPQGRFEGAELIDGARFAHAEAFGKHLFHHWDDGHVVHVHLGLFGRFFRFVRKVPPPRETTRMRLAAEGGPTLDLVGPTACALIDREGLRALLARLGPDPLREDAEPSQAFARLQRRRGPVGAALMDQSVLAGVGNVYRAEVLFAHGIHPERPANSLGKAEFDALWSWLVLALRRGVRDKRIITADEAEGGGPGPRTGGGPPARGKRRWLSRAERLNIYKASRCPRCKGPVRRWELSGRWAYACEKCQR